MSWIQQWLIASYSWSVAITYATLNPSDKSANITLSLSNTKATASAWWCSVRSTIWKSSGKWYWEVTPNSGTDFTIGIGNSSASLSTYVWGDINWWSYYSTNVWHYSRKINNTTQTAYGVEYTTGDVLWFALDMDWWTITCYKNNSSQWTMFSSLTWTIYAMIWLNANTDAATVNFWATTMAYTAPSWYNQWLYN